VAQVCSANGLFGIFKFLEILGSISYVFPTATKGIDIKIGTTIVLPAVLYGYET